MRVSFTIDEAAAVRNSLATRHDDLRDLIGEWAGRQEFAEQLDSAEAELVAVQNADAKLVAAMRKG